MIVLVAVGTGQEFRSMMVREPIVAGRFYGASPDACRSELQECLEEPARTRFSEGVVVGGIVPHAGWICSGTVAGRVFQAIADQGHRETVVLLGAVHRAGGSRSMVFPRGAWETPIGQVMVDERLADRLLGATNLVDDDPDQHAFEHSIEVQVPFIKHLLPGAKILPIMVPPTAQSADVGKAIGRAIRAGKANAVVVGSSDLTHYGPSYGFVPHGSGPEGINWAKNRNDRTLLDLIEKMDAEAVVPEVRRNRNACGAGAIAAAIAASAELGAARGLILEHTNSFETLSKKFTQSGGDSVGYAAVVFAKDESASPG